MFCLTFHYRSALTIFFVRCFTHCCQTLSLGVFLSLEEFVTLRLFPSGLLNTRNLYFLKCKKGIMKILENSFYSCCSGEKMLTNSTDAQCQCLVISAGPQCNTESTDRNLYILCQWNWQKC